MWRIIENNENYKIKSITVYPHHRLSLQLHHKRHEHWVIIKGKAVVTKNNQEFILNECEHIDIPPNTLHRLANNSNEPLTIIEIQYGICDEDDIIRVEDDYGRI
jgi:mannose-1-phosphate guanylyltransferase/mannose-6-phosphate isomerase